MQLSAQGRDDFSALLNIAMDSAWLSYADVIYYWPWGKYQSLIKYCLISSVKDDKLLHYLLHLITP